MDTNILNIKVRSPFIYRLYDFL